MIATIVYNEPQDRKLLELVPSQFPIFVNYINSNTATGKKEGRRIIAIGTTSVRTLEANMQEYGVFTPAKKDTNIFIEPGYEFKAIDCLITNFHLPKSTLIMLVSAFMGREFTLEVYKHAVEEKYHFFSFGDSMFIYGK